jgi:hypothetical protein
LEHALQGGAQVADAGGRRIIGIVREDVKDAAAQDIFAVRYGCLEVRAGNGLNGEVWRENKIQPGR